MEPIEKIQNGRHFQDGRHSIISLVQGTCVKNGPLIGWPLPLTPDNLKSATQNLWDFFWWWRGPHSTWNKRDQNCCNLFGVRPILATSTLLHYPTEENTEGERQRTHVHISIKNTFCNRNLWKTVNCNYCSAGSSHLTASFITEDGLNYYKKVLEC